VLCVGSAVDINKLDIKVIMQRVLIGFLLVVSMAGCTKPLLVVSPSQRAAQVEFVNSSSGHLQQFYFEDPVNCKDPHLIAYSAQPHEAKSHRIPAERLVTIWTSAWGLPAPPGHVAWCRPHAFSTRLASGESYRVVFEADPVAKRCGARLMALSGRAARTIQREIEGAEIGGGGPAGQFSCKPTPLLTELQ
jgi:hypothetical protein